MTQRKDAGCQRYHAGYEQQSMQSPNIYVAQSAAPFAPPASWSSSHQDVTSSHHLMLCVLAGHLDLAASNAQQASKILGYYIVSKQKSS